MHGRDSPAPPGQKELRPRPELLVKQIESHPLCSVAGCCQGVWRVQYPSWSPGVGDCPAALLPRDGTPGCPPHQLWFSSV